MGTHPLCRFALPALLLGAMLPRWASAAPAPAQALVAGTLKNARLEVTLRLDGSFDVRDLRNGRRYLQPAASRAKVILPAAPAAFVPDGDLGEWRGVTPREITPAMASEGKPECSALLSLAWADGAARTLCLAIQVRDRVLEFGPAANPWEQDSIEFWIGSDQFNLTLQGDRPLLRRMKGAGGTPDWRVGMKRTPEGYAAEIAMSGLPEGAPVPLAVGVNDANIRGKRQGQIYWPRGYRHGDISTHVLIARAGDADSRPSVRRSPNAIEMDLPLGGLRSVVRYRLEGDQLGIEIAGDPAQPMPANIPYPRALAFDAPRGTWVMPYKSGLAYPVRGDTFPFNGHEPSMPIFAAVDPEGRGGVLAVVETPFDAEFHDARAADGLRSIAVHWQPSLGKLGYARRITYHFLRRGTLMDAAGRYREVAEAGGKWVAFSERRKRLPQLERFIGAGAEFYGGAQQFAALHEMGVAGLLAEGASAKEGAWGFVPSRYDIYTDVYDPAGAAEWGPGHPSQWQRNVGFHFPADIIKRRDGSPQPGGPIITGGKKGGTALCYRPNQHVALEVLKREDRGTGDVKRLGLQALFLDVTTAERLLEDYDPAHPGSRTDDARWRGTQFEYLHQMGVLAGSEAGRDWAMPHVDWFLGIAGPACWGFQKGVGGTDAAGGMDDRAMEISQSRYAEATFSLARRAPIFELVYHGACRATHWWGDQPLIMPDAWDRRDLMHLLLDDMEVFRVYNSYARTQFWLNLERVAATCNLLGAWGQAVGYDRITDYRVLGAAGTAARTSFSGGLSMAVNLGDGAVATPEGIPLPPRSYLITGRSKRMPALPIGKPQAVAPECAILDGSFDVKALGYVQGWSAPTGVRLEADVAHVAPGRIGGALPELPLASARLVGTPPASGVILESRPFRTLGGWTYALGAWVRAETPCRVVLSLVADDGTEFASRPADATGEWASVGWSAVIPARAVHARLVAKVIGASQAVAVNVDDFRVDAGPPSPPLALPFRAGFDRDAMGWSGSVSCTLAGQVGHAEPGSLRVAGRDESNWSLAAGPIFRLAPGTRVRLSAWMRVDRYDPAGRPPFLKCQFTRPGGEHLRNDLTSRYDLARPGTWQRLEGSFTVPDEPTVCRLAVEKGGTHPVDGDLYVDDITLEAVP